MKKLLLCATWPNEKGEGTRRGLLERAPTYAQVSARKARDSVVRCQGYTHSISHRPECTGVALRVSRKFKE